VRTIVKWIRSIQAIALVFGVLVILAAFFTVIDTQIGRDGIKSIFLSIM
jgi:preprotein translocase subunit SecE